MKLQDLQDRADELKAEGPCMKITHADREALAVALVLQGYAAGQAHQMLFGQLAPDYIQDNDGALQMLARARVVQVDAIRGAALNMLGAFGGDYPDWLRTEAAALSKACEQ